MALKDILFTAVLFVILYLLLFTPNNDGSLEKIILRKPRISKSLGTFESKTGESGIRSAVIGAAIGLGTAYFLAPVALSAVGFTATGIASGSFGAALQSGIGNVAGGSLFAAVQSIAMSGMGYTGYGIFAGLGSTLGTIMIRGKKFTIDGATLEEAFDSYDFDEDDSISNSLLLKIFKKLDIYLPDLKSRYIQVTGRQMADLGMIKYREYLLLFDIKLADEEELKNYIENEFNKKRRNRGSVDYEGVRDMLQDLKVKASEENIEKAYLYVTGGNKHESICSQQFLNIFGL